MKTIGVAIFILALVFLVTGCSSNESMVKEDVMMEKSTDSMVKDDSVMMEKTDESMVKEDSEVMVKDDSVMMEKTDDSMMKEESNTMMIKYTGNVIAGTKTQYIEFNQADYDAALKANKVILLNFYASWCPTCQSENVEAIEAFNKMNYDDVVGFRVNYKDSDTDSSETDLAKEFGIAYQHTRVILVDGAQVLKNTESWDSDKYISELDKYNN